MRTLTRLAALLGLFVASTTFAGPLEDQAFTIVGEPSRLTNQSENIRILQILINKGLDINAIGFKGNTLLHIAAINAQTSVVNFLLENNIRTDISNGVGETADEFIRNFAEEMGSWSNLLGYENMRPSYDRILRRK